MRRGLDDCQWLKKTNPGRGPSNDQDDVHTEREEERRRQSQLHLCEYQPYRPKLLVRPPREAVVTRRSSVVRLSEHLKSGDAFCLVERRSDAIALVTKTDDRGGMFVWRRRVGMRKATTFDQGRLIAMLALAQVSPIIFTNVVRPAALVG